VTVAKDDCHLIFLKGVKMLRLIRISVILAVLFSTAGSGSAGAAQLAVGPAGYTFCAYQNGLCTLTGTGGVAFGASGHFNYKVAANRIACNKTIFGDPLPGAGKACYTKIVARPGTRQASYFTAYGYNDNDDGNGNFGTAVIAYPDSHHAIATEGKGTYNDPITLATDPREIRPHTMIYVPYLQKYFFMEDECTECTNDWNNGHTWRIDLMMGSNTGLQPEPALANCESKITRNAAMYLNARPGFPVDVRPLFANGVCSARIH
jgi:hypothetical protein